MKRQRTPEKKRTKNRYEFLLEEFTSVFMDTLSGISMSLTPNEERYVTEFVSTLVSINVHKMNTIESYNIVLSSMEDSVEKKTFILNLVTNIVMRVTTLHIPIYFWQKDPIVTILSCLGTVNDTIIKEVKKRNPIVVVTALFKITEVEILSTTRNLYPN